MKNLTLLSLLAVCLMAAPSANAQPVVFGVGLGVGRFLADRAVPLHVFRIPQSGRGLRSAGLFGRTETAGKMPFGFAQDRPALQELACRISRGAWQRSRQETVPGTTHPPGSTHRRPGGPMFRAPTRTRGSFAC